MSSGTIVEGPEWEKVERAYRKAGASIDDEMPRILGKIGLRGEREIRDWIRGRKWPANAQLTQAIKGSKARFIDRPQGMLPAITSQVEGRRTVVVGVLHNRTIGKTSLFNIAAALISGARIKVTPKMRSMFRALGWASQTGNGTNLRGRAAELWKRNKDWRALRDSTTYIVIPGYDFIAKPLDAAEFQAWVKNYLERAIWGTLGQIARGNK